MDRRWIGILIILFIGLGCMYLIVDNSNTVGNAITVIKDVSISVPPGYKIDDSGSGESKLVNTQGKGKIDIICIKNDKDPDEEFENALKSFQKDKDLEVTNKSNDTFEIIQFKDVNSGKNTIFVFFEQEGHHFIVKMDDFKDYKDAEEKLLFITDNMVHDFKQNK